MGKSCTGLAIDEKNMGELVAYARSRRKMESDHFNVLKRPRAPP
jgi:hypothetical protein